MQVYNKQMELVLLELMNNVAFLVGAEELSVWAAAKIPKEL